jgi:hypothetical protein
LHHWGAFISERKKEVAVIYCCTIPYVLAS